VATYTVPHTFVFLCNLLANLHKNFSVHSRKNAYYKDLSLLLMA